MNRNAQRKLNYKRLREAGYDSYDALSYRDLSTDTVDKLVAYIKDVQVVIQSDITSIIRGEHPTRNIGRTRSK